jgi:spore germination cell wall hydrolase CwlJ-like protein
LLVALAVAVAGPAPAPVIAATGAHLPETAVRFTFDDVECLALNIYHEARSEPEVGRLAVAAVTLNRVDSPRFPDSVCDVVKQGGERRDRCQFSWWCDGKRDDPHEEDAWEEALRLSRLSLLGLAEDPTGGALYYHADYVSPRWSRTFKRTAEIGRHHFYRPRVPKPIQIASSE